MSEFSGLVEFPPRCLCVHAIDGYETYAIDSTTIGVRPKWISVKDEINLPEHLCCYFVTDGINVTMAYYDFSGFVGYDWNLIKIVTHWMPLPNPPENIHTLLKTEE